MVNTAPAFSSAKEAAEIVRAGLGFLATANATALSAQTQAECLQILEQAHSMGTAARASILAAGTTAAWNPDKTKVLHSHGPPARPG